MCLVCDMQFLEEHEQLHGVDCECGRFKIPEGSNSTCYHCFAESGGLDPCRICSDQGDELLAELRDDPDLQDEANRVKQVLKQRTIH